MTSCSPGGQPMLRRRLRRWSVGVGFIASPHCSRS
jgi:hypothetical protein